MIILSSQQQQRQVEEVMETKNLLRKMAELYDVELESKQGFRLEELLKTLICDSCEDLLDDPQMLSCGHTFCADCVPRSEENGVVCVRCKLVSGFVTPLRSVKAIADQVPFTCNLCVAESLPQEFPEGSNPSKFPAFQRKNHLRRCRSSLKCENCQEGFATTLKYQRHVNFACLGALTSCFCGVQFRQNQKEGHFRVCNLYQRCCDEWWLIEPNHDSEFVDESLLLGTHRRQRSKCPFAIGQCEYGCGDEVQKRRGRFRHRRCPASRICDYCTFRVAKAKYEEHLMTCTKNFVVCGDCQREIRFSSLATHQLYVHQNARWDLNELVGGINFKASWWPPTKMKKSWIDLILLLGMARTDITEFSHFQDVIAVDQARCSFQWQYPPDQVPLVLRITFGTGETWIEGIVSSFTSKERRKDFVWMSRLAARFCGSEMTIEPSTQLKLKFLRDDKGVFTWLEAYGRPGSMVTSDIFTFRLSSCPLN